MLKLGPEAFHSSSNLIFWNSSDNTQHSLNTSDTLNTLLDILDPLELLMFLLTDNNPKGWGLENKLAMCTAC